MNVIITLTENLYFDANVKCLHLSLPLFADTHVYVVSQTNEVRWSDRDSDDRWPIGTENRYNYIEQQEQCIWISAVVSRRGVDVRDHLQNTTDKFHSCSPRWNPPSLALITIRLILNYVSSNFCSLY